MGEPPFLQRFSPLLKRCRICQSVKISSNPISSPETCYSKSFNHVKAFPILAQLNFQWLYFYLSAVIGRKLCMLRALFFFFIKEKKGPAITVPLILLLPDIGLVLCKATEWVKENLHSSFCEICHTAANCFSQNSLHRACCPFTDSHSVLQIYFYKAGVEWSWGIFLWNWILIPSSNMIIEIIYNSTHQTMLYWKNMKTFTITTL